MHQREQQEQSDGPLNRPKDAIHPSGRWIAAKPAAARKHRDAEQEGHISMYAQKVRIALSRATGQEPFRDRQSSFRVAKSLSRGTNGRQVKTNKTKNYGGRACKPDSVRRAIRETNRAPRRSFL